MEASEEVMGTKDLTHIVKGKRTKRQRPQSPIPFTITAHSSSGDAGGYVSNGDISHNSITTLSPATSTTEEDEDTAKCLILLAQGQSRDFGTYKFNSKRYIETPTNGKTGIYVYECKTCSKTFPSFQALGGHRASHKKPKAMAAEEKRSFALSDDDQEDSFKNNNLQLSTRVLYNNTNKSSKVHECSICGTEFTSGQALGGHMRRHRAPAGTTNTTLSLSPVSMDHQSDETKKTRNVLSLDLNLPAPEDDHHHRDSKFVFVSKQRQQQQQQQQQKQSTLVLSTASSLVDCHY